MVDLLDDEERAVDLILARVGKTLRVATPLALGKPNHLLNALYRRARQDPELQLELLTALTLERPRASSDLEQRFLGPFVERVWGDFPDPEYERDRVAGTLPDNVRVIEFYFYAGKYLHNERAQRDYISTNYTYAARDLLERGVNVVVQEVCRGSVDGQAALSLSCNPDISPDLVRAVRAAGYPSVVVGQINERLPFMYGDAVVPPAFFDVLVDVPAHYHRLFGTPKTPVSDEEYLIGLYASTLIKDGGELQIGIGSVGDALVYALKLRHEQNALYQDALERFGVRQRFGNVIDRIGDTRPFQQGLFAATEMLVDGFMHLIEAGIVKRRVYDDLPLTRLLNAGRITEEVTPATLDALLDARAVGRVPSERDVAYLRRWGILQAGVELVEGQLQLPDGTRVAADLTDASARAAIDARGLGARLREGRIVHAGFFLGPETFYQWLRDLPDDRRRQLDMRSVQRINQLYGHEDLDRLHRKDARFVNTGMMVTLGGAVVSDGLENGAVVSGVGGQYNFVAMAHALPDGRSILQIRSTHSGSGQPVSSVVFNYGHVTIARHQRDVIITEYGIAELRGKTDEEVAQALLAVADSRFQEELLARAKAAHKLHAGFSIPAEHRDNLPEVYARGLAELRERHGLFPAFPFGTDLTPEEIVLGRALRALKAKTESALGVVEAMAEAVIDGGKDTDVRPYLERMGLAEPRTPRETLYQRLVAAEVRRVLESAG